AAGVAAATAAIMLLDENMGSLGVEPGTRDKMLQVVGMAIAKIIGGDGAIGNAAAATAGMADAYNRQLHPDERALARRIAAASGGKYTEKQVSDILRAASNTERGENVTTGMVVDGVSNPQGVYDSGDGGATFTVPSGDGRTLVQSVQTQVDPRLAAYVQSMTGGSNSPYSWDAATLGTGAPALSDGGEKYSDSRPFVPSGNGCISAECIVLGKPPVGVPWSVGAGVYFGLGGEGEIGFVGWTPTDVKFGLGFGAGGHGWVKGQSAAIKGDLWTQGREPNSGEYRIGMSIGGSAQYGVGSAETSIAAGGWSNAAGPGKGVGTYTQMKAGVAVTPAYGLGLEGKVNFIEFTYKRGLNAGK
ncbi:hypothetical protein ACFO6P_26480, partial [Cupriavidus campinensis]